MTLGRRVVVLPNSTEYNRKYVDCLGDIVKVFARNGRKVIGVKLDDHLNEASSYKAYWFAPQSLDYITFEPQFKKEREEESMLKVFKISHVAEVVFLDDKKEIKYNYALFNPNVKEEDIVIVKTGHHGFALAKVVAVIEGEDLYDLVAHGREVVDVVDFGAFNDRRQLEKRAYELKSKMDAKLKEVQMTQMYEIFAEKDVELKSLLEEFKNLF